MMQIQSKADVDRLKQRVGAERRANKLAVAGIRKVLEEYEQGRAASACMADIVKLIPAKK